MKPCRASPSYSPHRQDRTEQKRRQPFPWNTSSLRATSGIASMGCDNLLLRPSLLDYLIDSISGGNFRDPGPHVDLETCFSAYCRLSTALDVGQGIPLQFLSEI